MARTAAAPARGRRTAAKPAPAKTPARATRKAAPAAKSAPARTRKTAAPAPAKRTRVAAPKPVAPPVAMGRDMDEVTGFVVGTDSHIVALELMKGGESRQDLIDRLRGMLDEVTRTGTPKPVANVVAATIKKLEERGFTTESSFVMIPPAPRTSKRRR